MSKLRLLCIRVFVLTAFLLCWSAVVWAQAPSDPTQDPSGALNQFWQAVVSKKWGLAAVIATMLFVAFARFIAPRIHGKLGSFIQSSRVSAGLAFLGGMMSAVAMQLMKGGTFSMQLIVYGFGFGVAAIGGYNAFWDLLFPKDTPTPPVVIAVASPILPHQELDAVPPPPVRPG